MEDKMAALESMRDRLKRGGEYLQGHWIDESEGKGNQVYKRLRWIEGVTSSGRPRRRAKALAPNEVARYRAQIRRGDRITEIERVMEGFFAALAECDRVLECGHDLGYDHTNTDGNGPGPGFDWFIGAEFEYQGKT